MSADRRSLREELADIRDRALREDPLPADEIVLKAAVLAHFEIVELDETGEALSALLDVSEPWGTANGVWHVPLPRRRALLRRFDDRAAVRDVLASIEKRPRVSGQAGFELLMAGPEAVRTAIEGADIDVLSGLLEARAWIEDVPALADGLPDAGEIAEALAAARRMAPLARLVGDHFSGRAAQLATLHEYLDAPDAGDILFVKGPGGVGKSTLLARFALDVTDADALAAIVYLNLDRPVLLPDEPLSLLQETLRQIVEQIPHAGPILAPVQTDLAGLRQDLSFITGDTSMLESIQLSSSGKEWERLLLRVAESLNQIQRDRPILVLLDTFEQASRYGPSVVGELWRMARILSEKVPGFRIVAAGRVTETTFTRNIMELEAFDRDDVAFVLAATTGATLPDEVVEEVYRETNGHPLNVRLTALRMAQVGAERFLDPDTGRALLQEILGDSRAALLYGRFIQQIQDPQVQRLAAPGLVMRRITAQIIAEVLAEPCGLTLVPGEEAVVFRRLEQELDLFSLDTSDPGAPALVHRSDVRALMLPALRDREADRAALVDARAIDYFSARDDARSRAEELYHRLWRGDPPDVLAARWTLAAAPLLSDAIDEVPEPGRSWLADRLGIDRGLAKYSGRAFLGREQIVTALMDYVDTGQGRAVFVTGSAGSGKTALLAEVADLARAQDAGTRTVYVRLSRTTDMRNRRGIVEVFSDALCETLVAPGAPKDDSAASDRIEDRLSAVLEQAEGSGPILLLVDDFERAAQDVEGVERFGRLLTFLLERHPRLRCIITGRGAAPPFVSDTHVLPALGDPEAVDLIETLTGQTLPDDLMQRLLTIGNGHPLTLQLLAKLVTVLGIDSLRDSGLMETSLDPLLARERLLQRVLHDIADRDVRRLLPDALLLRSVTVPLIEQVLAPVLGLELGTAASRAAFAAMEDLHFLVVSEDSGEEPTLRFRPDARTSFVAVLRGSERDLARRLDDAAVTFFEGRTGPEARAEELYHRMWRGDDAATLDARWEDAAAPLLHDAVEEMSGAALHWLEQRLGRTVSPEAASEIDQELWEEMTAREAQRAISSGDIDAALERLQQRDARRPGSELVAIEAELHVLRGDHAAAQRVLDRGIERARSAGLVQAEAELLLVSSVGKERRRQFADASSDAARALEIVEGADDVEYSLRALATLLRLHRKTRQPDGPRTADLKDLATRLLFDTAPGEEPSNGQDVPLAPRAAEILDRNAALARELAAEFGAEHPQLIRRSLTQWGSGLLAMDGGSDGDDHAVAFAGAVVDRMTRNAPAGIGEVVRQFAERGTAAVFRRLPEIVEIAQDRKAISSIAKPIAQLLATEVDTRLGAMPSKSMIARKTRIDI